MAVVQISRIQHRRGRELSGTGLPQLASGELGWAVDTRSLYIGNGSVSEGAPTVGNTKIITEHDNILDLVADYAYREGEIETREGSLVERSLQARLDDYVSLRSFGAVDGIDISNILQKALLELFYRIEDHVILYIEPGRYTISKTIYVPPYTNIIGAGKDKTVFQKNGNFTMFETISGAPGQYSGTLDSIIPVTQPEIAQTQLQFQNQYIRIEHLTVEDLGNSNIIFRLNSTRNSLFDNLKFTAPTQANSSGSKVFEFVSKNDLVSCNNNLFTNCEFENYSAAFKTNTYVESNIVEKCSFKNLYRAFDFADELVPGQAGPRFNTITNCYFKDINQEAVYIEAGKYNTSSHNHYDENIGTDGGSESTAQYPIIFFGESDNNSVDDYFQRSYSAGIDQQFIITAPYLPEVQGPVFYERNGTTSIEVVANTTPLLLFRLDADKTKKYEIDYFYESTVVGRDFTRSGKLEVFVNRSSNTATTVDDYETTGVDSLDENLKFSANLVQNEGIWAVQVLTENPNDFGTLSFKVKSKS